MPVEKIVLNASPLIVLFKARLDFILPALFKDIVIPDSVLTEITATHDRAAKEIRNVEWYKTSSIKPDRNILEWNLGEGESAVLSYALRHRSYMAVLDDAAARRCAKTFGIKIMGTGSILVLAAREGLISSFDSAMEDLKSAGLWISDGVIELLKRKI